MFYKFLIITILTSFHLITYAAVIEVTNDHDSGPGSFRQAIFDSNINPGKDTVVFLAIDTIFLETADIPDINILPIIEDDVCIFGNGVSLKALVAGRFLQVNNPTEIEAINFIGGKAMFSGGAIRTLTMAENVIIRDCVFISNTAPGSGGAIAIFSNGLIEGCFFEGNFSAKGGAISGNGPTEICVSNCIFKDNVGTTIGGAIYIFSVQLLLKSGQFVTTTGPFDQDIYLASGGTTPSTVTMYPGFVLPAGMSLFINFGPP